MEPGWDQAYRREEVKAAAASRNRGQWPITTTTTTNSRINKAGIRPKRDSQCFDFTNPAVKVRGEINKEMRYCEFCGVTAPGERIIDGPYLCEKC